MVILIGTDKALWYLHGNQQQKDEELIDEIASIKSWGYDNCGILNRNGKIIFLGRYSSPREIRVQNDNVKDFVACQSMIVLLLNDGNIDIYIDDNKIECSLSNIRSIGQCNTNSENNKISKYNNHNYFTFYAVSNDGNVSITDVDGNKSRIFTTEIYSDNDAVDFCMVVNCGCEPLPLLSCIITQEEALKYELLNSHYEIEDLGKLEIDHVKDFCITEFYNSNNADLVIYVLDYRGILYRCSGKLDSEFTIEPQLGLPYIEKLSRKNKDYSVSFIDCNNNLWSTKTWYPLGVIGRPLPSAHDLVEKNQKVVCGDNCYINYGGSYESFMDENTISVNRFTRTKVAEK